MGKSEEGTGSWRKRKEGGSFVGGVLLLLIHMVVRIVAIIFKEHAFMCEECCAQE